MPSKPVTSLISSSIHYHGAAATATPKRAAAITPPLSRASVDRLLEVGQLTLMWPCIQG
jgi:hypothetical protein